MIRILVVSHLLMQTLHIYLNWGIDDVVAPGDVPVPPYLRDTTPVRRDIARHYNSIHTMDMRVGEVLARLEADGLAGDTIVILTTDHGDGLPRGKRELFDSGIKVPMIIRWPEKCRPAGVAPSPAQLQRFVMAVWKLRRPFCILQHMENHRANDAKNTRATTSGALLPANRSAAFGGLLRC